MCELFAMSSRLPATVNLSLQEFSRHGGLTADHKDGWGVVYYQGHDVQIIREALPAFNSDHMDFVKSRDISSKQVISHIRKATVGAAVLENTQPFSKALFGRKHTFAHNGMLHHYTKLGSLDKSFFQPIGDTDSEYAFCILLDRMWQLWRERTSMPSIKERLKLVREFADQIRPLGPANFIYADGDCIMGHGDRRTHSDGIRPPGLCALHRACKVEPRPIETPGLSIVTEAESQDISLLASVPLTDEPWTPLEQGEIVVLRNGFIEINDKI